MFCLTVFQQALYDASSKLAFSLLLKRGVLWGSCGYSFRRRETKEQHLRGKKRGGGEDNNP